MTVDSDGFLWIALWDGWALRRYAPDGRLDATLKLPVQRATSCCIGGPRLRDLDITTATVGLDERELVRQPLAGALLRLPLEAVDPPEGCAP